MTRSSRLPDRLGALAGIAFALLTFLSLAIIDPIHRATDQELLAWWTDAGLLRDSIVSMYLKLGGMACFLVFLTLLRARLRAADPDSPWLELAYGAGIAFVATFSLGAVTRALIAQSVRVKGEPLPGPDTLRYATDFSDAAFGFVAIPFVTLTVLAVSLMILQTGALSKVVGWLGLVVAALSLVVVALQIGPFASPLIFIWALAASSQLFRARVARGAAVEAAPGLVAGQPQGLAARG